MDFKRNPKKNDLIFSSYLSCLHLDELIASVNIPIDIISRAGPNSLFFLVKELV